MLGLRPIVRKVPAGLLNLPTILALSIVLFLTACGGGGGSTSSTPAAPTPTPTPTPSAAKEWAWMSGSNTENAAGVYGTQGAPASANVPGARQYAVSWTDSSGNLWLFGGNGYDLNGTLGSLNDLWEFNPTNSEWTWVSGSNIANAAGVTGTQGVAAASNVPGARNSAVSWTDSSGNLWLFGGSGNLSNVGTAECKQIQLPGMFNDLWEFNPAQKRWTWVSGGGTAADPNGPSAGLCITQGVPVVAIGARQEAVSWIDHNGNLWVFGGVGYDSTGAAGSLNDLWEFNPTTKQWTRTSGSNTGNAVGVYGTKGVAAASNVPGSRWSSVSWTDHSGNLWLFGGSFNLPGAEGDLNDLWEFNATTKQWTWMSGSNTGNAVGVYGTQGVAAASNVPGARDSAVSWTDSSGNLWLAGGSCCVTYPPTTSELFNDLWEFNPATNEWTWMSGSSIANAVGVYGTQDVPAAANVPGARYGSASWTDSSGNFWLFGGDFYDSPGVLGSLNDLWRYQP